MESRFYSDHDSIKMERRCRMLSETFIENTSENTIESESFEHIVFSVEYFIYNIRELSLHDIGALIL